MRLSGDPVSLMLPSDATIEQINEFRRQMGFDRPLYVQYITFIQNILQGNFGESLRHKIPCIELVKSHLVATLQLAIASFGLAVMVSIPVGVFSALRPNSLLDHLFMSLTLMGQSAPTFWIGIMLILIFSVDLRLLPIGGRGTFSHIILPAVTLAAYAMASIARLTRSAMLDEIRQDYITTAKAKGLSQKKIIIKHALKNAAIPIVTIMGLQFGMLLGGAVVTETVFAWPGIGRLVIEGIYNRDYPVVQAVVFVAAFLFIVVNFFVDMVYRILDPRMTYE